MTLPAASEGALTTGSLTAGSRYLIEASGTYRWGSTRQPGRRRRVLHGRPGTAPGGGTARCTRGSPTEDHLDLYVDGTDLQAEPDIDTGDDCDTRTHTYRWTYQPARTGRVTFAVWDPTTLTDNSGALTIRVHRRRAAGRDDLAVPATAAAGVTSPGALEAGGTYLLTVVGTVDAGGGVVSDAECSTSPADPVWRRDRSVRRRPTRAADHLDVLVDRRRRDLHARSATRTATAATPTRTPTG